MFVEDFRVINDVATRDDGRFCIDWLLHTQILGNFPGCLLSFEKVRKKGYLFMNLHYFDDISIIQAICVEK